jgi:hypothetical protein
MKYEYFDVDSGKLIQIQLIQAQTHLFPLKMIILFFSIEFKLKLRDIIDLLIRLLITKFPKLTLKKSQ